MRNLADLVAGRTTADGAWLEKVGSKRLARLVHTLRQRLDGRDLLCQLYFVPGRIEVVGKHTDYAGGRSLVAATQQGFWFLAAFQSEPILDVVDVANDLSDSLALDGEMEAVAGEWSAYPRAVAKRLARHLGVPLKGAVVAFESNLPSAAGLSSSSALVVGFSRILSDHPDQFRTAALERIFQHPFEQAGFLGAIENGRPFGDLAGDDGVGTFGGSEDHTAIVCSRDGHLLQASYDPVQPERWLALPQDLCFVIADSGVEARKAAAALQQYNRLSEICRISAEIWRRETGRKDRHLAAILSSGDGALDRLCAVLTDADAVTYRVDDLIQRCQHFAIESENLVIAAGDALDALDLERLGRVSQRSQKLAEEMLGNQVPETSRLTCLASDLGAVASSSFGAGWGGSVWALTEKARADDFIVSWSEAYRREFPARTNSRFFVTSPAGPARSIWPEEG